jgi:Ca-activated chloride channel homolog
VTTVALPATGAEQPDLPQRILGIESGGSTNLSGGWLRGHELVGGVQRKGALGAGAMNRVILMTDGQANAGITDPARLVGLCRAARKAGVTTTTIGFGADYDEALLKAMAEAGGGEAYYIERPDQAPGVFEEELEGLLSLSAQNVAVEIRPTAAVELVAVHHRYPGAEVEGGVRVELGDLYAREPKALLLEFFVPGLGVNGAAVDIAVVAVTAYVLTAGGGVELVTVTLPIEAPLDAAGKAEPEVRREMVLLEAARAREAALEAGSRGDYAAGSAVLAAAVPMLRAVAGCDNDLVLREEATDLEAMAAQFEAQQVSAADEKYLGQRAHNAYRKREAYQAKLARRRPSDS